jgi:hypothetical protein
MALFTGSAGAQTTPAAELEMLNALAEAPLDSTNLGPSGIIPLKRGFNASVGTMSQLDSVSGWSSLLTPNLAYRFSPHFSIDAGTPIYLYISIYENTGTKAKPVYRYVARKMLFGDTQVSLRGSWYTPFLGYTGSLSVGMPSGNDAYGLGAGRTTYDFNNHFEASVKWWTPELEIGEGNTSTLVDQRIRKNYVSVGPMAHFQTGFGISLPHEINFDAQVYEQLPLKPDLVYSTTGKGTKKVTTATNIGPAEDNGLLSSLDIPLNQHVVLSGFYNHSIRDSDDLGGFSFTFLLRKRAPPEH